MTRIAARGGVLTRLLLSLLLIACAALLAFAAGTALGGRYLVPEGQGLAGPAMAMSYGLVAALIAGATSWLAPSEGFFVEPR